MAVPRSRPGETSPLKAAIDGTKRDLEQLRRQFARIPAVKPVEPAGGGIIGAAYIRSSALYWYSGSYYLRDGDTTYQTPQALNGSDISWLSISGSEITPTAGWYHTTFSLKLWWPSLAATPGPTIDVTTGGTWDNIQSSHPVVDHSGEWGIGAQVASGMDYMDGSRSWVLEAVAGADSGADIKTGSFLEVLVTKFSGPTV